MGETIEVPEVCSWCGKEMAVRQFDAAGISPEAQRDPQTNGICEECEEKLTADPTWKPGKPCPHCGQRP